MASDQSAHYMPDGIIAKWLVLSDKDVSLYAPGGGADQSLHCQVASGQVASNKSLHCTSSSKWPNLNKLDPLRSLVL